MKIIGTNKIKADYVDYVIIVDYGSENLVVIGQESDIESAITTAKSQENTTILKLVELKIEEV